MKKDKEGKYIEYFLFNFFSTFYASSLSKRLDLDENCERSLFSPTVIFGIL
jgi:hypothetical protein